MALTGPSADRSPIIIYRSLGRLIECIVEVTRHVPVVEVLLDRGLDHESSHIYRLVGDYFTAVTA